MAYRPCSRCARAVDLNSDRPHVCPPGTPCPTTPHGETSVSYDADGHAEAWIATCSDCGGSWDVTP